MDGLVRSQQRQYPSLLTLDARPPLFVSNPLRGSNGAPPHIRQFLHDIRPVPNKYSPVAKKGIRAAAFLGSDSAWNGEYFSAEVTGVPGGDERPGALAGLHDNDTQGEASQRPVTSREVVGERWRSRRELGQDGPLPFNLPHEPRVLGWVDDVDAAAKDRDRASLGRQSAAVGGRSKGKGLSCRSSRRE